jgi:serine/threonine protein kinase/tetratricopeptide (TPR) repeat protein
MSTLEDADPQPPVETGELGLGSRLRRDRVFSALFGQAAQTRVGHFVLLEPIATGGMGELFAAYDEQLDRKVALKLVRTDRASERAEARLLREAQALARLSHPNVIAVYAAGLEEHRVFVAMEYVRGLTLASWLERHAAMPEPLRVRRLLEHFRDAARGLEAVHRAGLAHRDFKPDNVLVGEDGRVRVLDFGLARPTVGESAESGELAERDTNEESQRLAQLDAALADLDLGDSSGATPEPLDARVGTLTVAGTLVGTPRYMAPEQWLAHRGDARSDQFSFCVALFHALYRRWPFEAASSHELRAAVLGGQLRVVPRKPEVSPRLHAALLRGLQVEADARNPDMNELLAALDELLAPRSLKRRVLALGLFVVLGVLALVRGYEPPPPLDTHAATHAVARELESERRRVQISATIATLEQAGRHADAELAFETYARLPEHQNTLALARAWLERAATLRGSADAELVLAALGEAVLASASEVSRRAALVEIAHVLAEQRRHVSLGATLRELDSLPGTRDELLELELQEALSRRDIAAALALLAGGHPLARDVLPILRELEQVTSTAHLVGDHHPANTTIVPLPGIDLDDDRHDELLLLPKQGPPLLVGGHPALTAMQVLDLPLDELGSDFAMMPTVHALGSRGGPAWVHFRAPERAALFELGEREGALTTKPLLGSPHDAQWVLGPLHGLDDAGWAAFGASPAAQRIVARRGCGADGPCEPLALQPDLSALRSLPRATAIADLDGDGDDELIVGSTGWWAYDVRVLEPLAEPGHFELAARHKLGGISTLITYPSPAGPRIAAAVVDSPPSRRVFPPEQPAGAPAGVYLLRWAGGTHELERIDEIPVPDAYRLGAGDLDGDGRAEIIVDGDAGVVILVSTHEGRHVPLWLEGLSCLAIQDLDLDGDAELIVREHDEGRVLVLGSGDARLPSVATRAQQALAVPASLEPDLTGRWQRAETLAGIGLAKPAQLAFEELARVVDPRTAKLAQRRAGELAQLAGARREAARAYELAGDPDSLARAFELYEATHVHDAAARVAAMLAAHEQLDQSDQFDQGTRARWQATAARSQLHAEPRDRLEIDFRQPLDERWQVARGELLQLEAEGLRFDAIGAHDSLVMRRELEWTGERLHVELDFELERLEWGSGMTISLHPLDAAGKPSGDDPFLRVIAFGGGDYYMLDFDNNSALEPGSQGNRRELVGAAPPRGQRRFRVSLDVLADADQTWLEVTTLAGEGPRDTTLAFERPRHGLSPGRFELRVETTSEPWMRGRLLLLRLGLLGARDVERVRGTIETDIARSLARGEHELALAQLDTATPGELDPREAAWLRVLALEQLGRWTEALPELERALDRCADAQALRYFAYGVLLHPDRFAPTLRRICTHEQFARSLWQVGAGALFQHKDLDDLHRTLTTHLVDIDRIEPGDEAMLDAVIGLLTARARGWSMQSLPAAAESDLRRVLALVDAWPESPTRRRAAAIAELELAAVLLARDQPDAAALAIERALARDEAPEIIADVALARPLFRALREHGVWATIAAVQRGRPLTR